MGLPIIIAIVTLFVGFGLLLLFFYTQRIERHRLQTLAESRCPSCSTPYGAGAAERACQEYLSRCDEERRRHPNAYLDFMHHWEIRCPQCGAGARFYYETGSLVRRLPEDRSAISTDAVNRARHLLRRILDETDERGH